MTKKFAFRALVAFVALLGASAASVAAFSIAWFSGPNIDTGSDDYLDGSVGLRNYFFAGKGTADEPYEIVSPVHFYNLTRLQNIGVFSGKTYFQIGHVFDIDGVPTLACMDGVDEHGDPIYVDYLDMEEYSQDKRIRTIGGEGVPFVGEIDGHGFPIKNLKVYGNPEDVGVFGYVAHEGLLKGLVFENLEVTSLGYNNTVSAPDHQLFSEDIDDIFHSASYLATDTSLSISQYDPLSGHYSSTNLKKLNGASGTQLTNINASNQVVEGTKIFNGFFKATFPNRENDPFTYSLISSSPVITEVGSTNIEGASSTDLTFDFNPLFENVDFNKLNDYQVNAKLYLTASVKVDGYVFSRVIQSYSIELYNNSSTYNEGKYGASIFCDYIDQGVENDKVTGYHHGVNVGLVAGHVDGSVKDCYVFNGTIKFNETGYHPIAAETDTALIGEIGKNVHNDIDPDIGLVVNGDIGIMNFSKIYSLIRKDATKGTTISAGQRTKEGTTNLVSYISYKEFLQNDVTLNLFADYLRYYDGKKEDKEYIVSTGTNVGSGVWHDYTVPNNVPTDFNSVDFLWNKVIEDEEDVDRGLGVFKVVTSYNADAAAHPESYGIYMLANIGDARIVNGSPISKVYFSTAEFDHTKDNSYSWWGDTDDIPKRGTDLPSYSDLLSFDYPFSRDFNYVFELDLSKMDQAGQNDYMYNTDSNFLTNYLNSKLIDKYGDPVAPGSPRFGFMFRSSENETLDSLSSYMPIGKPGDKQVFETEDGTKYYPSNSIVFSIENPNGANISVVANNEDATVYSFNPDSPAKDVTPMYSMKSKSLNQLDMNRYFTYDVATGATGTETVVGTGDMKDGNALYGHIFKLPKGNYVLGACPNNSTKTNIYFLAVQGQTEGTIGAKEVISIQDKIEGTDFLLEAPTYANYPTSLNKALFTFKGHFNEVSGNIVTDVYEAGDKKYMRVTFNNSPLFITSATFRSRLVEHVFMINGVLHDLDTYQYIPV